MQLFFISFMRDVKTHSSDKIIGKPNNKEGFLLDLTKGLIKTLLPKETISRSSEGWKP